MRKIENLLQDSLVRAGIQQKVDTSRIINEVKKLFLNMFGVSSRYSITPTQVKEQMLIIEVRNEEDIIEIKKREEEILTTIEKKLKKPAIKRLRFQAR